MAKTPEGQLLKLVMDWLAAEHIFALRMNSGTQLGSHAGKKWAIHMNAPGTADVLAFPQLRSTIIAPGGCHIGISPFPVWIELKAPKGKQSDLQRSFQAKVESFGHRYLLIRSLDELIALLSN